MLKKLQNHDGGLKELHGVKEPLVADFWAKSIPNVPNDEASLCGIELLSLSTPKAEPWNCSPQTCTHLTLQCIFMNASGHKQLQTAD